MLFTTEKLDTEGQPLIYFMAWARDIYKEIVIFSALPTIGKLISQTA
jgi:hypothetical protein